MIDLRKFDLRKLTPGGMDLLKRQAGGSLLGLAFDSGRLEGIALRRTNGSVEVKDTFSVSLSLDPLTNAPELVGREIRKHLDAAEIRERRCAVCLPLNWALTLVTKLPDLPEPDLVNFLRIEAERGFPYAPESLIISISRFRTPAGEPYATQVAVPRDHVSRLESVLKAAQLKPVTFSLGIAALQSAHPESAHGVLALVPGEQHVGLQVTGGGGVAVLRALEGAYEPEGGEKRVEIEHVARELRITLGQLPSDLRASVRRVRIFGRGDTAEELAEQLRARVEALGLKVEQVKNYAPDEFGIQLPADTTPSPALSLAVRHLTGQRTGFEFLPPKISQWQQLTARYSSRKLVWAGATAGAIALLVALAFLVQQVQLWWWQSKWAGMRKDATELAGLQQQIKRYRPWFDDSFRELTILRRLTEAFPEDGTVAAKTIGIRDPATVTCSGTARDQQSLLKTLDRLRTVKEVTEVQVAQIRGKSPLEFTFNFRWSGGGSQ